MPTSKSTKTKHRAVAITTGDADGIGFEVSAKALAKLGPQAKTTFFLFRDHKQEKKQARYFELIDKKFSRFTFTALSSAIGFYNLLEKTNSLDKNFLFDLALEDSPADWVIQSTHLCLKKFFSSLVTGPISKTAIRKAGYSFVGHTGIFRHFCPKIPLFMGFIGKDFNVLLATDHIALSAVEKQLSHKKFLKDFYTAGSTFRTYLKNQKPMGLLGLNPHAGEKGIVGTYEEKFFKGKFPKDIHGPLSPDAAFLQQSWNKYSLYLVLYHDQGLIPFKMHHGQNSGVHITVGLPFLRTSVDHGTAKEIFNKDLANSASMFEALAFNLKILNGEKI